MERRPEPQRRTMTLWERMSVPDPAIRDFLKVPHDDEGGTRGSDADRRPCTLMDAICRDSRGDSGAGTISWKPLRDRLRLRRAANARSTTATNHRPDQEYSQEDEDGSKAPAPASLSLMAMLEQTDGQWDDDDEEEGSASSSGAVAGEEHDDGEGRREEETVRARCCVCMVRHKGAAFIPCGHTFCRRCSRELWHTGASCPLCNAFIHDILHIF